MLQTAQIRAARALLGWNQADLATAAKVSIATIRRIEGKEGPVMAYVSTLMRIQSAFEKARILFLDDDAGGGIGVRLQKKPQRVLRNEAKSG
jgi:transcriptional regulator with XRE-family HTH domain